MGLVSSDKLDRSFVEQRYYRIPLNLYPPGTIIQQDLFFLYQGNYLLYKLKNLFWKDEDLVKLNNFEVKHLYIRCASPREHHQFLENRLKTILEQENIAAEEKAEIVYVTSSSLMEELFEKPTSPEHLKRSITHVQNSIDFLTKDKAHFFLLMEMATNKFSEFTHGLHTAAYAITLAGELGIKSFNELSPLGISALLHDIGKVNIPQDILNKENALTDDERILVEKHPVEGYEIARKTKILPSLAETVILQHHERPSGRGYPHGLTSEIDLHAQIVGLCDTYDSLTSHQIYQKAMKPYDAIQWIRNQAKEEFNPQLVTHFIKMLKRS